MEKLETISLVCTFGVVACGLTVIIAATVRVIRDVLRGSGTGKRSLDVMLPLPEPPWTQITSKPVRRRKRPALGPKCPHCDEDLSDAQVLGSETTDEKTVLTKECPSCKRECSIESK